MKAPTSTPGTAKMRMFTIALLKTYQSQLNPLSKINTGIKINKII